MKLEKLILEKKKYIFDKMIPQNLTHTHHFTHPIEQINRPRQYNVYIYQFMNYYNIYIYIVHCRVLSLSVKCGGLLKIDPIRKKNA